MPSTNCYCGTTPGTLKDDDDCDKSCSPADTRAICGGSGKNSVYGTGRYKTNQLVYLIFVLLLSRASAKRPVNGGWRGWSGWGNCNSGCRQSRRRDCDNPTPMFGGATCSGSGSQVRFFECFRDNIRALCSGAKLLLGRLQWPVHLQPCWMLTEFCQPRFVE